MVIKPQHFQEWLNSAVSPEMIELNVSSLAGGEALERLTENAIASLGEGQKAPHCHQFVTQPVKRILDRYSEMSGEGWWVSGIDVLTGEPSDWGCFKSDRPRLDQNKLKPIKYEHPAKTPTEIFALRVSYRIGLKIAKKYDLRGQYVERILKANESGEKAKKRNKSAGFGNSAANVTGGVQNRSIGVQDGGVSPCTQRKKLDNFDCVKEAAFLGLDPDALDKEDREFWAWVIENPSIALLITEGAKKAGALLTAGYCAIALPGINAGYRQEKDSLGNAIGFPILIPQLVPFCGEGREITFFFDQDTKSSTIKNVQTAIERTGKPLSRQGCQVSVCQWDKAHKGIDDFIFTQGEDALDRVYEDRISLDQFKIQRFSAITPNLVINERYIPQSLEVPESAKIIAIKAPKGTGKTEWIAAKIAPLLAKGERVLVLTHRTQLGLELSRRFGVNYRTELAKSEDGTLFGYVFCVDSAHGSANPRFNPNDWEGATVIIDECEQVFWHLLNSPTCEKNRVKIIDSLRELLRIVIATSGKIYLADADLKQNAISHVQSLIGYPVSTFIIENTYQSPIKRNLYRFNDHDPSNLIQELEIAISSGQKPIVHTDGQKHNSLWGTRTLEHHLKKKYPDKKILRIDGDTVSDRSHAAYGCMGNLNEILSLYDVVICSPVIETGVSIDVKHFDTVFGISHGVQTVESFCQSLARVRDDIPRYIWAKDFSPNRIGNGSSDLNQLLAGEHFKSKNNIRALNAVGLREMPEFDFVEDDLKHYPSLLLWAKNAVLINSQAKDFKKAVTLKLESEGYKITLLKNGDKDSLKAMKNEVTMAKEDNYTEHKQAVIEADSLTDSEFSTYQEKRELTEGERNQLKRARIERLYGTRNLTSELITKDDKGWYPQIRLHYFLTVGSDRLVEQDRKKLDQAIKQGEGKVFKPDLNRSLLSAKVQLMRLLNVEQFFGTDKEFTSDSLAEWLERLQHPAIVCQIKSILGFTISKNDTGISFAQRLLAALGLKLTLIHQRRYKDGSRRRVYRGCDSLADGRGKIFDRWLDASSVNSVELCQAA